MSFMEVPQVIVLSSYFNEKKELADSIRISGNPLGGVIFPLIFVSLVENFGLRLSFILLSAIILQFLVLVALIQPYQTRQKIVHRRNVLKIRSACHEETPRLIDLPPTPSDTVGKVKKCDLGLFKDLRFLCYVCMMVLWSFAYPHMVYFTPIFGKSIMLTPKENSLVMTYQSLLDFFLRIGIGVSLHKKILTKEKTFISW